MRNNNFKSAKLWKPSLLESRSDLLHLWTTLGRKRIQPIVDQKRLDVLSIPHYVIKKERPPRCSARQNWSTERAFCGRDASERILMEIAIASYEMHYIVTRNSKLARPRRSASQWIKWHKKTTPIGYPMRNIRDNKTLVFHTEQIWQECTDETSIRLPNRSHINEPSPPRIWRRTCRTNPFSTVPKVAPVFFQCFMVELGQKLVELIIFFFKKNCCSKFVYSW